MSVSTPPVFRDFINGRSTNPFSGRFFSNLSDPTNFTTDPNQFVGGIPVPGRKPAFNELVAAALFQANLARQIRGTTRGEATGLFGRATGTLRDQLDRLSSLSGSLDTLETDLTRSAAGSTLNAQLAALEAARTAGGGRGGLAFGGGAGAIAARATQGVAATQASSLTDALARARLGRAQFRAGVEGQRGQVATALSGVLGQQAGFLEGRSQFDTQLQFNIANLLAGLAQPGSQVSLGQGQIEAQNRQIIANILGGGSAAGTGGFFSSLGL